MFNKILISSPSGVGDSILFGPALKLLAQGFPRAELHALVMYKSSVDFFERFPEIKCVHYWDYFHMSKAKSIAFLFGLKRNRFDLVINAFPANRAEYNLVSRFLGGKTAGHRYLSYNLANLYFLNHHVVREMGTCHAAEENVRLAQAVGATGHREDRLLFPLTVDEKRFSSEWLRGRELDGKLLLGIHPGCNTLKNHARRRWPPRKFALLGKEMFEKYGMHALVFGGPEEKDLMDRVAEEMGDHVTLVTSTTLGQAASLIAECGLFVCNDSGLMHVASAVQTPCVPIIGPTNPVFIRPYGSPHVVASNFLSCSPCFWYSPTPLSCKWKTFECIRDLTVEHVASCCTDLLENEKLVSGGKPVLKISSTTTAAPYKGQNVWKVQKDPGEAQ